MVLSSKSIIDVIFINEKEKTLNKFKVLYSIPAFIAVISSIYTLVNYPNMLDMVPTHWSFTGTTDGFVEKSFFNNNYISICNTSI
ncbi:DUF1648 domain-containing protein [Romboutsia sp.]|uniref:DUF1648 domain-containing protein n=1 Tax=Romboutsia sp. TaxID=1965302 RepID=UPI002D807937|nr:DUF1648 domain-containing protein [Romboutsia sp.]